MGQSQAFHQLTAQGEHRELVYRDIRTFQISILKLVHAGDHLIILLLGPPIRKKKTQS